MVVKESPNAMKKPNKSFGGIGKDAKCIVGRCEDCQIKKASQRREPLLSSPLPERLWDRIGIDLLDFKGRTFLVFLQSRILTFKNFTDINEKKSNLFLENKRQQRNYNVFKPRYQAIYS